MASSRIHGGDDDGADDDISRKRVRPTAVLDCTRTGEPRRAKGETRVRATQKRPDRRSAATRHEYTRAARPALVARQRAVAALARGLAPWKRGGRRLRGMRARGPGRTTGLRGIASKLPNFSRPSRDLRLNGLRREGAKKRLPHPTRTPRRSRARPRRKRSENAPSARAAPFTVVGSVHISLGAEMTVGRKILEVSTLRSRARNGAAGRRRASAGINFSRARRGRPRRRRPRPDFSLVCFDDLVDKYHKKDFLVLTAAV